MRHEKIQTTGKTVQGIIYPVAEGAGLITHTDISGFSALIPAGTGIGRSYSDRYKAGIEIGGRFLLSDDLESESGIRKRLILLP